MKRLLVFSLCCLLLACVSCSSSKPKPDAAETKATYGSLEPGLTTLRSAAVPADPRKWALVVGIERYSHLQAVEFAASDARTAANYFINLLGVPERNVILLENEKATRSAVTSRLKDYLPEGMRGQADNNSGGRIGLGELYGYVKENAMRRGYFHGA